MGKLLKNDRLLIKDLRFRVCGDFWQNFQTRCWVERVLNACYGVDSIGTMERQQGSHCPWSVQRRTNITVFHALISSQKDAPHTHTKKSMWDCMTEGHFSLLYQLLILATNRCSSYFWWTLPSPTWSLLDGATAIWILKEKLQGMWKYLKWNRVIPVLLAHPLYTYNLYDCISSVCTVLIWHKYLSATSFWQQCLSIAQ